MLVKRYHAEDMQQAMDTVIKELGSDAVILNSRKVRKKGIQYLFKRPILEVMVAYDPAKVPTVKKFGGNLNGGSGVYTPSGSLALSSGSTAGGSTAGAGKSPAVHSSALPANTVTATAVKEEEGENYGRVAQRQPAPRLSGPENEQLKELDNRIESLDSLLNSFIHKFSFVKRDVTYDFSPEVEDIFRRLIENQVREEVAYSIAKETDTILRRKQGSSAAEVAEHLLLEQLGAPAQLTLKKFQQSIILFLGPTGVGKTTTLVKLAANFAIKQKKRVGIINTDTYRIAAQEQLKTYADILSIPLSIVYQIDDIQEAIESMSDRDIIFIDTAGKRPGDEQHIEDITRIMEISPPADVLLCISASTSYSSVTEVIDTYNFVGDYKLLVTKLDETRFRGMILNMGWYSQKRFAYVTTGQNVPDDIERIDMGEIVGQLLR